VKKSKRKGDAIIIACGMSVSQMLEVQEEILQRLKELMCLLKTINQNEIKFQIALQKLFKDLKSR